MSKIEQPKISEYPIVSDEKLQVLSAYTIYKFMDPDKISGRWQAVLKVKTTYVDQKTKETKPNVTVRVFRWQWRDAGKWNDELKKWVPSGTRTWTKEHEMSIGKPEVWSLIKSKVDEFLAS